MGLYSITAFIAWFNTGVVIVVLTSDCKYVNYVSIKHPCFENPDLSPRYRIQVPIS